MFLWIIGWWLLLDSIFSILYYLRDKKQTWKNDHSIRLIRGAIAVCLIIIGYRQRKGETSIPKEAEE